MGVSIAQRPRAHVSKIDLAVAACCVTFIAVLALSAYWDPTIRVLHVFEAIPYAVAALLSLGRSKFGYALAAAAGGYWLWHASVLVTFVRNGFEQLAVLLRTGDVNRPDVLIAAPAAIATAGMVVFALIGYSRVRNKSWTDAGIFIGALALVVTFYLVVMATFAPQFLTPLRRFLNL